MAPVPIFYGDIDKQCRVVLHEQERYLQWKRSLSGKPIELVLRRKRSKRSLDQNAYIHAVPIPLVAEKMGESINDAKLIMMGEKWGWHIVRGYRLPVKGHTSEMTTAECAEFIEWAPMWAATELDGLYIPLPNEVEL